MRDNVDWRLDQWRAERPDLDPSPMGIVARAQRAGRILDRELSSNFARHDLQLWEFDVLATLLRSGTPYELTAGQLLNSAMVTSGAITNRIDRLVARGMVTREVDAANRRSIKVRLTEVGRAHIDKVVTDHVDFERRLLSDLSTTEQAGLTDLLRRLLVVLGDTTPDDPLRMD